MGQESGMVLVQAAIGRSWNKKSEVSPSLSILSQGLPRPSPHGPVFFTAECLWYVDCFVKAGDLKNIHSRRLVEDA